MFQAFFTILNLFLSVIAGHTPEHSPDLVSFGDTLDTAYQVVSDSVYDVNSEPTHGIFFEFVDTFTRELGFEHGHALCIGAEFSIVLSNNGYETSELAKENARSIFLQNNCVQYGSLEPAQNIPFVVIPPS